MNRIHHLDENLINKIAAGEVVERPASIVKELLENAIDAGADKITIELQEGGRKRIVISDNGCGMSPEDAKMAIVRHATSKISTAEDLFNLHTMGFRGEALASISSVSKFTLMTCEQSAPVGVRLYTEGGSTPDVTPWQSGGGTTIICDDIFYNVPVRQKFLKGAASEYGAVYELVQAIALSKPELELTLVHNGKETLRALKVMEDSSRERVLRQRFAQVMRGEDAGALIYKEASSDWGRMTALLSAPGVERGSAKDMFLFVNGRWVRDKSIRFAVLRGYHSHLLRGKYPVVGLFLTMDPALIDANVHPAKTEVRLQYAQEIHGMIAGAVREALRAAEWAAPAGARTEVFGSGGGEVSGELEPAGDNGRSAPLWASPSKRESFSNASSSQSSKAPVWKDVTPSYFGAKTVSSRESARDPSYQTQQNQLFQAPADVSQARDSIPWGELCYMGSVADCYLMFSHGDRMSGARMLVLDQHAFHERVLYERLIRDQDLLRRSQPLLVPEAATLSPDEIETLREMEAQLRSNGFTLEFVGADTVEVRAVPVILAKADIQSLLESIAGSRQAHVPMDDNSGLAHEILSTIACHSAVRAGEALGDLELKALLNEARDVDFFHNCPHGRRVFRWWDEAQIARWFDR